MSVGNGNEDDLPPDDPEPTSAGDPPSTMPDEVYCTSCGDPIKEQAEICPHCGVPQRVGVDGPGSGSGQRQISVPEGADIPPGRAYELQKLARKDPVVTVLVSLLVTPLGYVMVGKVGLALLNFFTFNFFLLGFIIVPIHVWKIIHDARDELNRYGVGW